MFTGLVACRGTVTSVSLRRDEARLAIRPMLPWEDIRQGESIACNGVCLTVESWDPGQRVFTAYASRETCSRTNIGLARAGLTINLERALAVGERLGGHIVSGHVDTVASVESISSVGESRVVRFSCDAEWCAFIAPKGSVALDGISLTVNGCGDGWFDVNLIPSTVKATTAEFWKAGAQVNVETDVLAKYVWRLLGPYKTASAAQRPGISMEFLLQNGFGA